MSVSYEKLQLQRFDPDALLHVIDNTQMEHRLLGGGLLDACWQRLELEDVTIMTGDYGFPVLVRGSIPQGALYVGSHFRFSDEVRMNYHALQVDQLQLYAPGKELHYITRARSEWIMLAVSPKRLQETVLALLDAPLEWPRRDHLYLDLQPAVAEAWRQGLRSLLEAGRYLCQLTAGCLTNWLNSEGLLRLLIQTIASALPQALPSSPLPVVRKRCLMALESSIEHWLAQPFEDLRITKLAGTSERLVQLASHEIFGVTPHRWCKLARLNAAYRDLLRGTCTSVTTVCQRWGFEHMGRFAMDYRALFGESPKETLLRVKAELQASR